MTTSNHTSSAARQCANCVFWSRRDRDDGRSQGRCHARLLEQPDPRLAFMTQAEFVCGQWCGQAGIGEAAE